MTNPKLSYKEESVLEINQNIKRLFQIIYQEQKKEKKEADDFETPKIKVSEFISKMSFYYEKIRNSVDYKEEYLLRKNAILRILRRLIVIEGVVALQELKSHDIAKNLLVELIRAGYLPNNSVPETKIDEIGAVVEKYIKLRRHSSLSTNNKNEGKSDLTTWILTMAACDIEERLGRTKIEQTIISDMYEKLRKIIQLPGESVFAPDREIQIYIGIHRAFLKFDNDLVGFILFKYFNAHWNDISDGEIEIIGKSIEQLREAIEKQIEHPLTKQLNKIIKRYNGFYSILLDVIEEDPVYVYDTFRSDPKAFPRDIKKICSRRYNFAKTKLWRAAVRSIIYIFLTKSIFVILLEVPATKWFGEEINPISLAINICFPAFLLFLAVMFTRLPSDKNTDKIITGINEIVFVDHERKEPIMLRRPVERGKLLGGIFGVIYTITFFFSFGLVIWALNDINFNWVSITIFLFFLAFVSFFAIRIRKGARELMIIEPKETIFGFLVDFFYIPIVSVGKWLSEKFARVNVFVFIMDFIIEAPFKIFVEMAEEWTKYVKERKEDIM